MSAIFGAAAYGNAALYWDPNGVTQTGLGPTVSKWLIGNATQSLTINSNLGFPALSPYANFASPVRYGPSGPSAIVVFPVRFGVRFGIVPSTWSYPTAT